jgi:hypothetical protein
MVNVHRPTMSEVIKEIKNTNLPVHIFSEAGEHLCKWFCDSIRIDRSKVKVKFVASVNNVCMMCKCIYVHLYCYNKTTKGSDEIYREIHRRAEIHECEVYAINPDNIDVEKMSQI